MAFSHGSVADVYVNGYDLTAFLNSVAMASSVDTAETTTFGSSAKTYIPGIMDGTVSAEGFFDGAAAAVDPVLATALGNSQASVWNVMFAGDGLGNPAHCISCIETAYDVSADIQDAAKISVEGQSIVGVERGLVAHALQARSTTGNGTALDNLASSANGGSAFLQATAFSGLSSIVIKVQHSTDNVTFADLATFTTVAAAPAKERITFSGTVNRYVRASWTISGTGSCTFAVAVCRK